MDSNILVDRKHQLGITNHRWEISSRREISGYAICIIALNKVYEADSIFRVK